MTLSNIPQRCKVVALRKAVDQRGPYKFDAVLEERDIPSLEDGQILVKIEAAGFNHREVRLRRAFLCAIVMDFCRFGYGKACTLVSVSAVSMAQTGQVRRMHDYPAELNRRALARYCCCIVRRKRHSVVQKGVPRTNPRVGL